MTPFYSRPCRKKKNQAQARTLNAVSLTLKKIQKTNTVRAPSFPRDEHDVFLIFLFIKNKKPLSKTMVKQALIFSHSIEMFSCPIVSHNQLKENRKTYGRPLLL